MMIDYEWNATSYLFTAKHCWFYTAEIHAMTRMLLWNIYPKIYMYIFGIYRAESVFEIDLIYFAYIYKSIHKP